jgi:hypothetical protein
MDRYELDHETPETAQLYYGFKEVVCNNCGQILEVSPEEIVTNAKCCLCGEYFHISDE